MTGNNPKQIQELEGCYWYDKTSPHPWSLVKSVTGDGGTLKMRTKSVTAESVPLPVRKRARQKDKDKVVLEAHDE